MARMTKELGRNRDLPQLESTTVAAAAAGSGADFEVPILWLPNLMTGEPVGGAGINGINAMRIRYVGLIFMANLTGVATNNCTINVNQYRGGAILVNTTSATTITAGQMAVTPASMANIFIGTQLVFSGGTGATETVTVQSVTQSTFTATFVNGHSGAYAITSAPLVTITYASGLNETAKIAHQFPVSANTIMGGDILTLQRVSNGTGLATPVMSAMIDWINAGYY